MGYSVLIIPVSTLNIVLIKFKVSGTKVWEPVWNRSDPEWSEPIEVERNKERFMWFGVTEEHLEKT